MGEKLSIFSEPEQNQGLMTLALMQSWPEWVHRRVDHITFDDLTAVAVRASLDFTVPEETWATASHSDGTPVVFVPLSLFLKQRITAFSLRDESDRALPILTRPTADRVTGAALWAQAHLVRLQAPADIALPPELMPERIERTIMEIATARPDPALESRAWLVERSDRTDECDACFAWRRLLRHSSRFKALSLKFTDAYTLITPMALPNVQSRRVIKLTYEAPRLLGGARQGPFQEESPEGSFVKGLRARARQLGTMSSLRPYPMYFRTGVVGRSRCYHQEAEVPPGLQLTAMQLGLYDSHDGRRVDQPDILIGKLRRAHLHVADVPSGAYGVTQLLVRGRINNIARSAWLASAMSLVLLIAASALAIIFPSVLTEITALLLVPPAILSAYIARPTEPLVATEVLFGLRLIAAMSSGVAFFGAGAAAVGARCTTKVLSVTKSPATVTTSCSSRPGALIALLVLTIIAAVLFVVHTLIRRNINQPPEHQHFRALQRFYRGSQS
jgi:hypothetical protein